MSEDFLTLPPPPYSVNYILFTLIIIIKQFLFGFIRFHSYTYSVSKRIRIFTYILQKISLRLEKIILPNFSNDFKEVTKQGYLIYDRNGLIEI